MDRHCRVYEQFCWVLDKNVVFEQTVYHNGTNETRCVYFSECRARGGCRNRQLRGRLTFDPATVDG